MIPGRPSLRLVAALSTAAALLLLMACTPSHPQSTFDAAGPVADKQLTLFYIIFWAAVVVFVVVVGILLYSVIRFRRKEGEDGIPAQIHGNTPLEIAWTIAPAIVLVAIAVPTVIFIFDISDTEREGALEVTVIGHQWWWEFEYPEENVITANELHVPVDRPVKLSLKSDDLIHSFWIPKLAGKVDMIPSNVNKMWFEARRRDIDSLPEVFFGQCAEFCGESHANMRFKVIVEEPEQFDDWVDKYHEIAGRGDPPEGDALDGAQLFASKGCTLCHSATGPWPEAVRKSLVVAFEGGAAAFPGPNLTNVGTRNTLAAGVIDDLNRSTIMEWLRDPEEIKPGNRMAELANVYSTDVPEEKLTEEDIEKLTAYLLSLR